MPRAYTRHGLHAKKARIQLRGFGKFDLRMAGARAMLRRQEELTADLGGDLSAQRRMLVEDAVRTKAQLDHVDAHIAALPSLVTRGRRPTVLPIVVQRTVLADHLVRVLDKLGLERVPKQVLGLHEYLAQRYAGNGAATDRDQEILTPSSPAPPPA
jgi:hypothetical protein